MTSGEFVNITNRLEKYYDKEYNVEQKKIMFDTLKEWSAQQYAYAVKYCLENSKYLPRIADLKQALADYKPNYKNEDNNFEYVDCIRCNKKGLIQYFRKIEGNRYEYMALCNCNNGKYLKQTEYRFLPFIDEINKI